MGNKNTLMGKRFIKILNDYGIVLVLLVIFVFLLTIASPYFLTSKNIMNVLRQVSVNGLISIGMTFCNINRLV